MSGHEQDYAFTRSVIASGRKALRYLDTHGPQAIRVAVRTSPTTRGLPFVVQEFIAGELSEVLRSVTRQAGDALDQATRLVDDAGSPSTLRDLAALLERDVARTADELASLVRTDALEATVDEEWSGTAAQRYRQACEGQGDAIARVATATRELTAVLEGMANQLDSSVVGFTAALIGVVTALVSLAASLGTAPATLGATLLAVYPELLLLAAALVAVVTEVWLTSQSTKRLADDAQIAVQAWPDSRFGDRK